MEGANYALCLSIKDINMMGIRGQIRAQESKQVYKLEKKQSSILLNIDLPEYSAIQASIIPSTQID